jgi:hypothetical protein
LILLESKEKSHTIVRPGQIASFNAAVFGLHLIGRMAGEGALATLVGSSLADGGHARLHHY